jgi:transposase
MSIVIGIDVSKAALDVAVRPGGESWRTGNDPGGIAGLVGRATALAPGCVVVEATGGLERAATAALAAAGLPVAVVNPRQVRDFAKATGRLAKTDALDAAVLAHFGEAVRPAVRPVPDARARALAELVTRRQQLVEMRTAEQNRLGSLTGSRRERVAAHLAWLRQELADLEAELDAATRSRPVRPGGRATRCCAPCPAWGRRSPARSSRTCPNWARSTASGSPPWSASPP